MNSKPIKVLQFICSRGLYGAEKWILALADNSDRASVEHTLAVTREGNDDELELFRQFKDLGLSAYEIEMKNKFDLRSVSKLCQLIKDSEIDIIHTHGYKSDILGLMAAKKTAIPCVTTPHGFENSKDIKLRAFIALGCQTFRFFDKVVPLSTDLMSAVSKYGIKPEKLQLVVNAVNVKELNKRAEEPVSSLLTTNKENSNYFVIGYIGQLIPRKNVHDLISAFSCILKTHPQTRLLLVGEGIQRQELEATVNSLGIADNVTFTGFVDNPVPFYQQLDLFAMTSSLEGIPRSMMEAMSLGVPVAAYNIPGVDILVKHDTTGMLVEKNNSKQLQDAILRGISDPDFLASLASNARNNIHTNFSADRMAKEYRDIYTSLI